MLSGRSQGISTLVVESEVEAEDEIFVDDEHTADHPYCSNLDHSCHTDWRYHQSVTGMSDPTAEELALSAEFFGCS
jgi:hypothetical protein